MQKAQDKELVYVIHHPRLPRGTINRRFGSEGSSADKTHPKGSSADKTRLRLPKRAVDFYSKNEKRAACMEELGFKYFFVSCLCSLKDIIETWRSIIGIWRSIIGHNMEHWGIA